MDWKILFGLVTLISASAALPQTKYYNQVDDETLRDNDKTAPSYQVTENVIDIPDDRTVRGPIIAHTPKPQLNLVNNKATTKADDKESNWNLENNANWNTRIDKVSNNNDNSAERRNNLDKEKSSNSGNEFNGNKPDKIDSWSSKESSGSNPIRDIVNKNEDSEHSDDNSKKTKLDILHIKAEYDDGKQEIAETNNKKCTLLNCIKNYFSGAKNRVVKGFRNLFSRKDALKSIDEEAKEQFSLIDQLHKKIDGDDDDDEDDEFSSEDNDDFDNEFNF